MHYEHFMGLRDGSYRILSLAKTEGLITFPSFHTVMSVLMILALRGKRKDFLARSLSQCAGSDQCSD